jgi:hypothetical protein
MHRPGPVEEWQASRARGRPPLIDDPLVNDRVRRQSGYKAGVSAKVISGRLGHASVAFTLHTYSHVIRGMDREAAATVADLILTSTQKGPGTVVPGPSANNGPQSDVSIKEVKDERPAQ